MLSCFVVDCFLFVVKTKYKRYTTFAHRREIAAHWLHMAKNLDIKKYTQPQLQMVPHVDMLFFDEFLF